MEILQDAGAKWNTKSKQGAACVKRTLSCFTFAKQTKENKT